MTTSFNKRTQKVFKISLAIRWWLGSIIHHGFWPWGARADKASKVRCHVCRIRHRLGLKERMQPDVFVHTCVQNEGSGGETAKLHVCINDVLWNVKLPSMGSHIRGNLDKLLVKFTNQYLQPFLGFQKLNPPDLGQHSKNSSILKNITSYPKELT